MSGVKNRVTVKGTVQVRKTVRGGIGYRTLQGEPGKDGISPQARVDKSGDTVTITITDAEGTTTETVKDGQTPQKGVDYLTPEEVHEVAEEVLQDKIITDMQDDITDVKGRLNKFDIAAASSDVGKALKVKTVSGGKVTEYEFGDAVGIDATLTQQGQAADAKKVGDEISDLRETLNESVIKKISDYSQASGSFKSDGTWINATSPNYKHIVIPILPDDNIKIVAGSKQGVYAVFSSYTQPTNGEAIPYSSATGFTGYFNISPGTSEEKTAPSDASYLYISMLSGGNVVAPSNVIINGIDYSLSTVDNLINITKISVDALTLAQGNATEIAELKDRTSYDIFTDYPTGRGSYNSSQKWTNISANYMHSVIGIKPGDSVLLVAGDRDSWCGILTSYSNPVANEAIPFSSADGFTKQIDVKALAAVSFTAPSDAVFLVVGIKSSGNDTIPAVVSINGIDIKATTLETLKKTISQLSTVSEISNKVETDFGVLDASVGFNSLASLPKNSGLLQAAGTWTYVNNPNHDSRHVAFPVKPGDSIVFTNTLTSVAFLKDYSKPTAEQQRVQFSDKTGYTGVQSLVNASTVYRYIVPYDVKYMYVLVFSEGADKTIGDITINGVSVKTTLADNFKRVFEPEPGVKWCTMGDSITYGYWSKFEEGGGASSHTNDRENIGWAFLVAKENNWDLTNIAIGGEGYVDIASGSSGYNGYKQARDTDFSAYDLVSIALGINDWKANCQMGSFEDDQTAETITGFIPAMRATLEAIMTSNPFCKIIVITPLNANGYNHDYGTVATNWGMGYAMSNSGTLKQFLDKMIEVCELYGVEYVDISSASCINSIALPTMLPDGVHPAIETHKLLARELAKKINFK